METITVVILILIVVLLFYDILGAIRLSKKLNSDLETKLLNYVTLSMAITTTLCLFIFIRGLLIESEIRIQYEKAILNNSYEIRTEYSYTFNDIDTLKSDTIRYVILK